MSQQILDYKCPNCHGSLNFDVSIQKMKCEMCDSELDMAAFKEYESVCSMTDGMSDLGDYKGTVWEHTGEGQVCNSCAGQLITDGNTIATECPFCGNTAIIRQAVSNALRPDFVIPFKYTKDEAMNKLTQLYKGKALLPKCFKTKSHLDGVTGLYVPFWLYDCETHSNSAYDATRVSTFWRGNTQVTRTDKFMATRAGTMAFDKVPAFASSRMTQKELEQIEPFNYTEMKPFSGAFLAGHAAEKHDIDFAQQKSNIDSRIRNTIDTAARKTVSGYNTVNRRHLNVGVPKHKINYALFPVWILSTRWKNKVYKFTMNGQTGQFAGELPVNKRKAVGIGAAITGICALLGALIFMFAGIGLAITPEDRAFYMIFGFVGGLFGGAVFGGLVSAVVIWLLIMQLKIARRKHCATGYASGFNMTHRNDIFLGSRTTVLNTGGNMGRPGMGGRGGFGGGRGGFGGGFRR
ncbi:MAG: hypothetical protein FWC80_00965 [Firmicutes bacterium]|nr:hypothetical protein [Bacillota bacterium]